MTKHTSNNTYEQRRRTITQSEWCGIALEWSREGGTIEDGITYDGDGRVQRTIIDHGSRIRVVYTISDAVSPPSQLVSQEQLERQLVGRFLLEIWPIIIHPTAYPLVWNRLEAILCAHKDRGSGQMVNALLEVCTIARTASDDDVATDLMRKLPVRLGIAEEALTRCIGRAIVAATMGGPLELDAGA